MIYKLKTIYHSEYINKIFSEKIYIQAHSRAATDRQPYKMGVLKFEISLTRSNFAVHIFDFDILCILLWTTYMQNFEVPCTVV